MGHAAEKLDPRDADVAVASDSFRKHDSALLRHAKQLDRDHPGYLASLGMTAEQYAHESAGPSMSIEESVEAGWMSAAEGRFLRGEATLDDLLALGHPLDEARALLTEQEQACAFSV